MEKTWSADKGRVMRMAYLRLCKMALTGSAFFYLIFFFNHHETTFKWDILVGAFIYFLITTAWQATPYSFSIDTVNNTLSIYGMNLLRKERIEIVNLSELDTEIIRDVQSLWIDRRFTFRLIKNDKVLLKIKEDTLGWSHETLQEISSSIQSFKGAKAEENELDVDTEKKAWSINTRRGMWTAYLYLSWYLLCIAFGLYLLYIIIQENWPDSYWIIYACTGLMLLWIISRMRQFAPYSFSVDTDNHTLSIKGMNMFGQKKRQTASFNSLDAEFIREYNRKGGIDSAFTLTLMTGGTVLLKIKEGHWGWNEEKLREIHEYIQENKVYV